MRGNERGERPDGGGGVRVKENQGRQKIHPLILCTNVLSDLRCRVVPSQRRMRTKDIISTISHAILLPPQPALLSQFHKTNETATHWLFIRVVYHKPTTLQIVHTTFTMLYHKYKYRQPQTQNDRPLILRSHTKGKISSGFNKEVFCT